jgi:hypothetical protein
MTRPPGLKDKFQDIIKQLERNYVRASVYIRNYVRLLKVVTAVKGSKYIKYIKSKERIEIDLTYDCNLRCASCNRSCTQAPSKERMTVAQIEKFVKESIDKDIRWKLVSLLGGEPTLHPDILTILSILLDYKKKYSPDMMLRVETNGTGDFVKNVLTKLPPEIVILNSNKGPMGYLHTTFNVAPIDTILYKLSDFSNGCYIIKYCGTGLTRYGYYCCAIAGSIDRVFGFDMGRKTLPGKDDSMVDQLNKFCRLCGHFKVNEKYREINFKINEKNSKIILSPTWKKAYKEYERRKPELSLC